MGDAWPRRIRARQCLAPTMCPNVGATHWVALGHSRQRACSWLGQTNREACLGMVGVAGRRRIRARQCLAPTMCPNVGATHWVALGHSRQHARSWLGQTNREAWPRGGGRRRVRARQCLAPTMCPNVGATHWVALGHSCQRARSRLGQTNREAVPRGGGRRRVRARQCLAPTMCPNVGATHWVALGHSRQRARSRLGKTNREAWPRDGGRRGASPDKGEAVPRPYYVSQRRGDPLGRPRSFMPTRSFMAGTNKSRGVPR